MLSPLSVAAAEDNSLAEPTPLITMKTANFRRLHCGICSLGGDILGSLHPVRRHLESPGDDERDGKTKHGQHDHRGCNTVRQMKCRDYSLATCKTSQPTTAYPTATL